MDHATIAGYIQHILIAFLPQLQPTSEQVFGRIIGRWAEDQVRIRLDDGRAFEAPTPEETRQFEVGDRIVGYVEDGVLAGWYLPSQGVGVDSHH
jgi:hypothetical protein